MELLNCNAPFYSITTCNNKSRTILHDAMFVVERLHPNTLGTRRLSECVMDRLRQQPKSRDDALLLVIWWWSGPLVKDSNGYFFSVPTPENGRFGPILRRISKQFGTISKRLRAIQTISGTIRHEDEAQSIVAKQGTTTRLLYGRREHWTTIWSCCTSIVAYFDVSK
jgi:hypothetical protein